MSAAAKHAAAEREKLGPHLGRALRRRRELGLIARDSVGLAVPLGAYGRLLRDANDVIAHERSGKPGHLWVIDGRTPGQLMGLGKHQRRSLGIVTFGAVDETDRERAAYIRQRRRERDKERRRLARAKAKAGQPPRRTVVERAKALGVSERTLYRQRKKLAETKGFAAGGRVSVGASSYLLGADAESATPPATAAVPQARPAPERIEDIAARRVAWARRNPPIAFDRMRPEAEYARAARFLKGAPPRAVLAKQISAMYAVSEALHVTMTLYRARDNAGAIVSVVELRQ